MKISLSHEISSVSWYHSSGPEPELEFFVSSGPEPEPEPEPQQPAMRYHNKRVTQ